MSERAESVVRDYYDALRNGEALEPYFLEDETTVKFGISEGLFGFEQVSEALREQSCTTDEWTIESTNLVVDEHDEYATVADEVTMAWTDTESGERRRFETRWSGTLVRRESGSVDDSSGEPTESRNTDGERPAWAFHAMHVSTPDEL
ncbi:DUF3225 domain-containing protein [Natronorubrum sp. JWXQ-INN-674]|uniref:DUF3225 domain-containing protein n=1 Tax=Natronorubrum halalkaliphilum TaxID=2691917 RepID=A0A6B0VI58_9EURY|nr:nuclear transport factor 2 family protein [Natronorubrum halalkaliphilum]MXV61248.1 DUF3225 domain-containing protein [Natronorubrum halalkaliphilum]